VGQVVNLVGNLRPIVNRSPVAFGGAVLALDIRHEIARLAPIIAPRVHFAVDLLQDGCNILPFVHVIGQPNEMHSLNIAEASDLPHLDQENLSGMLSKSKAGFKKHDMSHVFSKQEDCH
jgi:hypothetical protein